MDSEVVVGEEKRREEDTYTYIRTRTTNKKHKTFYIKPECQITITKLAEILEREGKSVSQWILDNAESYVRLHEPGNPQQTLTYIIKNGKPYRARTPSDCKFWNPRPKAQPPYTAFCGFKKELTNAEACCTRWKLDDLGLWSPKP